MQDIPQETHHETTRLTQSAQVVLWEIDLTEVGGERYFFCNEQNEKGEPVTWQRRQYQPYPIQGTGFELNGKGSAARPTLTVSNLHGMVTGMAEDLQSLVGGTVVRRKVYARFLDAVNFVNGNSDAEGNTNIAGVTVVFRAGEQEQTRPEGFESSGSETVLGTEVKYDTPITRTITSANIDRLRFTFGVQALVETTSKGDRNPSEVRLLVQIQRNGGWVTEKDITIKGKTTSQYLASVVVGNLPPRPFNIRMRRMTPDSTTDQLQNKTLWSSYTEIIDVKQCYPNTALVGVQVDSEQFGSQQVSRNYHLRGRILQVPSTYNPQTRQYSGMQETRIAS